MHMLMKFGAKLGGWDARLSTLGTRERGVEGHAGALPWPKWLPRVVAYFVISVVDGAKSTAFEEGRDQARNRRTAQGVNGQK